MSGLKGVCHSSPPFLQAKACHGGPANCSLLSLFPEEAVCPISTHAPRPNRLGYQQYEVCPFETDFPFELICSSRHSTCDYLVSGSVDMCFTDSLSLPENSIWPFMCIGVDSWNVLTPVFAVPSRYARFLPRPSCSFLRCCVLALVDRNIPSYPNRSTNAPALPWPRLIEREPFRRYDSQDTSRDRLPGTE